MRKLRLCTAITVFVLFLSGAARPLAALSLEKPALKVTDDLLRVSATIDSRIPYRVMGALDDGLRIQFRYEFRLHRYIDFFLANDPVIISKNVIISVQYNLLEGIYTASGLPGGKRLITDDREKLFTAIRECSGILMTRWSSLKGERSYYVESRLLIRSVKMYPPFSFLSILSLETDWKRSEKVAR